MTPLKKVALVADIPPDSRKVVECEGMGIVIFNIKGSYFAVGRNCPHEGGHLDEGTIEGMVLTCPSHGMTFDLTTGDSLEDGGYSITRYEVMADGESIFLGGPIISIL